VPRRCGPLLNYFGHLFFCSISCRILSSPLSKRRRHTTVDKVSHFCIKYAITASVSRRFHDSIFLISSDCVSVYITPVLYRNYTGFLFVEGCSSILRFLSAPVVGWTNTDRYLAADIQLVTDTGRPQLWSASERIWVVPCTHNSFGDRSFSAVGPRVWNALPSYLRQDMNYRHFKRALKGHMFWSQSTTPHCD